MSAMLPAGSAIDARLRALLAELRHGILLETDAIDIAVQRERALAVKRLDQTVRRHPEFDWKLFLPWLDDLEPAIRLHAAHALADHVPERAAQVLENLRAGTAGAVSTHAHVTLLHLPTLSLLPPRESAAPALAR